MKPRSNPGPPRLLALGDSYTIGEQVAVADRWPNQVAARLREEGLALADPEIIAHTGWTTDELAVALARANPTGPYDVVTLLIGVNNQYRGRLPADYRGEFASLLDQAITLAGGEARRVVVLSIPDWGVMPFASGKDRAAIGRDIDAYNAINRTLTLSRGAAYVDVTPLSREAPQRPGLGAEDGLHPSGIQYSHWAELALPAIRAALVVE